jgi:uncharacterized protein YeaC (DUF1315 family)
MPTPASATTIAPAAVLRMSAAVHLGAAAWPAGTPLAAALAVPVAWVPPGVALSSDRGELTATAVAGELAQTPFGAN